MKKATKFIGVLVSVLLLTLLCTFPFSKAETASAGSSKVYVASDSSISQTEINVGQFYTSGVTVSNKMATFSTTAQKSYMMSKNKIENLKKYGLEKLFDFSCVVRVGSIAEGGTFQISLGLDDIDYEAGADNSFAVNISYNDGIYIGLSEYLPNGNENELFSPAKFGALQLNKDFIVALSANTDNQITFSIDGKKYLTEEKLAVSASGYMAFYSYGKNNVSVGSLSLIGYKYDLPENIEYTETFDNGYNANVFYSESTASPITPSSLSVKNSKFVFENVASGHITTKYVYSNFELSFDISNLQAIPEFDENGNILKLVSNYFGIAYGLDAYDVSVDQAFKYSKWLQIGGVNDNLDKSKVNSAGRYVLWDNNGSWNPLSSDQSLSTFNLWDANFINGQTVNVKFKVTDGLVELYMKFEAASDWIKCFSYDTGTSKTGYIRIMTWGSQNINTTKGLGYNGIANFTIDNLSIKNTDYDGAKKVVESPIYKSNIRERAKDYNYTTSTDDSDLLAEKIKSGNMDKAKTKRGCSASNHGILSISLILLCAIIVLFVKKHSDKKGHTNE